MRPIIIAIVAIILLAAAIAPGAAYAFHAIPVGETAHIPAQQRGEAELPWLFAVYIITWAAFFGYVFFMSRRQREMQREIDALKDALDDTPDTDAKG